MVAMLGEMLLKVGALTPAQLEQVLNAQAIYGGRLGTNLVEMGLLDEDELARVLYEKLGVPCVDIASLNSIPQEILSLIPLEMVQRYRVLPVALNGKKLTLAMADPSDFNAIDEIGFVTGLVIVPRVCSELRLSMALERYFGIKRTVRYIPVEGGARTRFAGASAKEWDGVASVAKGRLPATQLEPLVRVSVESLAERFSASVSEVQVVVALLAYVRGEFDRGAFLSVRRGMALGVQAIDAGGAIDGFGAFVTHLEEAPLLRRVVEERSVFLGELPAEGAEGRLLQAIGGAGPSPGLLMPLSVDGQVAAVLCASDGRGRLGGGLFDLQRVAAMAELTFEMICLRKRIKTC